MHNSESKDIVRRWNREIEAENRRREAVRRAGGGPWRAVAWLVLWLAWLALLVLALIHLRTVQ